jgi:hypothetical protein
LVSNKKKQQQHSAHFCNAGVGCAFTLPNNAFLADVAIQVKNYIYLK